MQQVNQLISFEGSKIILPPGFQWEVHRYFTPSGMQKSKHVKFSGFDQCIHKWQDENFHMFELRKGTMRCMAYCVIKSIQNK